MTQLLEVNLLRKSRPIGTRHHLINVSSMFGNLYLDINTYRSDLIGAGTSPRA